MALPNITRTIIAQGFNCLVRAGQNASDAANNTIALVSRFQATEDFGVQGATVLGHLGPVSYDPQSYDCNLAMDGFMPFNRVLDKNIQYADGGKISVMEYIPTRAQHMDDADGQIKIAYLDFYNRKSKTILAAFEGILITNDVITAEGNTYVRYSVQAKALNKSR